MSPAIELEGVQSNDSNPRYLEPRANSNQSRFARHTLLKIYPRQLELPVNSKQFSYPFRGCSLHILPSITRTTSNLLCQYVTETKQTM